MGTWVLFFILVWPHHYVTSGTQTFHNQGACNTALIALQGGGMNGGDWGPPPNPWRESPKPEVNGFCIEDAAGINPPVTLGWGN